MISLMIPLVQVWAHRFQLSLEDVGFLIVKEMVGMFWDLAGAAKWKEGDWEGALR